MVAWERTPSSRAWSNSAKPVHSETLASHLVPFRFFDMKRAMRSVALILSRTK